MSAVFEKDGDRTFSTSPAAELLYHFESKITIQIYDVG